MRKREHSKTVPRFEAAIHAFVTGYENLALTALLKVAFEPLNVILRDQIIEQNINRDCGCFCG